MIEWIVVDRFGNQIAGPFFDKIAAENVAKAIPNATNYSKALMDQRFYADKIFRR